MRYRQAVSSCTLEPCADLISIYICRGNGINDGDLIYKLCYIPWFLSLSLSLFHFLTRSLSWQVLIFSVVRNLPALNSILLNVSLLLLLFCQYLYVTPASLCDTNDPVTCCYFTYHRVLIDFSMRTERTKNVAFIASIDKLPGRNFVSS